MWIHLLPGALAGETLILGRILQWLGLGKIAGSLHHRQARVENAFFRYKSIIGDRLRARHPKAQKAEALIACNILNGMTALGRPASCAVGA